MTTEEHTRGLPFRVALGVLAAGAATVAAGWLASPASAVPAQPGTFALHQPDGTSFRAQRVGDEWYNAVETARGFTVLQGPRGWWRYAEKAHDGSLERSTAVVGRDAPPARPHLRDRDLRRAAQRKQADAPDADVVVDPDVGGPSSAPALGTEKSLVILAQFLDQSSLGTTPAQWNSAYFGAGKSVKDYYSKVSGGAFTLAPAAETHGTANDGVVGWVTLNMNHPNQTTLDADNRAATRAAILAADPYVNYASFDTNGNGTVDNHELHVTVIAAGQEASCCAAWGKSVWGHRWWLQSAEVPSADGEWIGGWGYTQFGEMHGDHMATLGIMAHEIGHDLEWPDLYDTDQPATSRGVGLWSLMGYGSWLGVASDSYGTNGGQTPPFPDAWSRWAKGWITPTEVTGTQTRSINAASSGTTGVAVQLLDNPGGSTDWGYYDGAGTGEYFLVENRQPVAGTYDASLPGGGLLVLHVHESRDNNRLDTARLVDVEEADGLAELDVNGTDVGDAGDLYPGSSNNRSFGAGTNPNSNLINGTASGVAITAISDSGASMSASFTAPGGGGGGAPANDLFGSATTVTSRVFDETVDTTGATVEAGETAQTGCPLGGTVWYRFTPARDVRVTATTSGSSFDTVLAMWRGTSLGSLTAQGCNDDALADTLTSAIPEFVAQAGQTYYVQAGGYYDSVAGTVSRGSLQVHLRIRPVNDDFAAATTLTGASGTVTGNNVNASKETGEPLHGGNSGGSSVWWQWTAPSDGQATLDTLGSTADDTLLAVYTGTSVSGTALVAENDDIVVGENAKSRVTFPATAGTTYRIAVDGFGTAAANRGDLTVNWSLVDAPQATDVTLSLTARDLPGHVFGYRLAVSRTGGVDASPVTVTLALPPGVSLASAPAGCSAAAVLTCGVGSVSGGVPTTLDVAVSPLSPGPHTALATLTSTDDEAAGNTSSAVAGIDVVCDNSPTAGDDRASGSLGEDVLGGLGGDDVLSGRGGDDLIFGGSGIDTVSYADATGPMVVNLNFQELSSEAAWPRGADAADGNDRMTGIEAVEGSAFGDQLLSRTAAADTLVGLAGADLVYGYGGADLLLGSAGRDKLFGGTGPDRLYGGTGRDRLDGGPKRDLCRDRRDVLTSCER